MRCRALLRDSSRSVVRSLGSADIVTLYHVDMARYSDKMTDGSRIVCVTTRGRAPHRHVASVGVETASHWTASQIRAAMADGRRFVVHSQVRGIDTEVRPFDCGCGVATLRSFVGSTADAELEDFATCPELSLVPERAAAP
jgi:hypothetical protein